MIIHPFEPNLQVFGGCDLSSVTDLTAWAKVQRLENGWLCNWRFWLPDGRIEAAERRDGVPYARWEREGFLETTPGKSINHDVIMDAIITDCLEFDIGHVGFDPWNTEWLAAQLEKQGINSYKVSQGYQRMSEPSKHLQAAVAEGTFRHGHNPIASWMAENVEVKSDEAGNIRPVKPQDGSTKRIDGIVAAIIAIAVAITAPDQNLSTAYDEPGNLAL